MRSLIFFLLSSVAFSQEPTVSTVRSLTEVVVAGEPMIVVTGSGTLKAPLVLKPNQTLRCEPGVVITCEYGVDGPCIEPLFGCTIDGCSLVGKWVGDPNREIKYRQGMHGIGVYGEKNVTIQNCTVSGFHGDGFYAGPRSEGVDRTPAEFLVVGSRFEGNKRNGGTVASGIGKFKSCQFIRNGGASPGAGLDLEPADGWDYQQVTVEDCKSEENKHAAWLIAWKMVRIDKAVPVVRFINCTGSSLPPWQLVRLADVLKTRIDKDPVTGAEILRRTNDGHPAENLPKGTLVEWNGFPIVHVR